MKDLKVFLRLTIVICFLPLTSFSQITEMPLKWLSFDEINVNKELHIRTVEDRINNQFDTIIGNYVVQKDGVKGNSLLLDGYSAYLSSENFPLISGSFTIEGWLAMGAYPFSYCPIGEQISLENKGFSLGINHLGNPVFKVATPNGWIQIEGKIRIPIRSWAHICGVYSEDEDNIILYLDGEAIAQKKLESKFIQANDAVFYSGRTTYKEMPEGALNAKGTKPIHHFFDGLVDEIKIWDTDLTEKDLNFVKAIKSNLNAPALNKRSLPNLPKLDEFGAFYTNLKFYESWDHFWRTSDFPDVVVSFGKSAGHFVFWRGTSYIPHWVTENGVWYNDEFNETWSDYGCHEPMSDKRNQYSHVRIIENTPARTVIHWRYALNDNWYRISNVDTLTGWGDWTDEIYTIYPDGMAVRSQTLHSSNLSSRFEWHEGIIIMGQGQRPEDVLYPEALIMANMEGEEHVYSWEPVGSNVLKKGTTYVKNKTDQWLTELPGSNIQIINTRSKLKPFTIINPDDEPVWDFYHTTFRDISIFPWWNHWPTSVKPSDGRNAIDSDRASHSSLTHVREWKPFNKTEFSETRLMLVGLTDKKASNLVSLSKSWSDPPKLFIFGNDVVNEGYRPEEKAYHLRCINPIKSLQIKLDCSPESPGINPSFVISNWAKRDVELKINGERIKNSQIFRNGISPSAKGTKLIFWIEKEFYEPVIFEVIEKN